MENESIVCIVGPTACGKSAAAMQLATYFPLEIVSADSVQVYRDMDIGSAKPSKEEQSQVPHHLIDCIDIDAADFSVAAYFALAKQAIEDINARGKLPLIVGGSGLYINSLTFPLRFAIPSNSGIREALHAAYLRDPENMYRELQTFDPASANRIHPNDEKRIVRALEVYYCSGKPFSAYGNDFENVAQKKAPFRTQIFGLTMKRELLYHRIEQRVDMMLASGLLEEAQTIYRRGYSRSLSAMQSIGYKQLFNYFDGNISLEQAILDIKTDTRHLAKRQLTWFRRDPRIHWITVDDSESSIQNAAMEMMQAIQNEGVYHVSQHQ